MLGCAPQPAPVSVRLAKSGPPGLASEQHRSRYRGRLSLGAGRGRSGLAQCDPASYEARVTMPACRQGSLAEAALSPGEVTERPQEVNPPEGRPVGVDEEVLGVGGLPQHEA